MTARIISVSGAPYDGHSRSAMLDSVAKIGFTHFEPAFIVGYTEPFDETAFSSSNANEWRKAISIAGLSCHAFSSHIDLGLDGSVEVFTGRMEFAAALGAKVIATNAAARAREASFFRNVEILLKRAETLNITIALENPGDGSDNLINTARDGVALVERLASPFLKLNYDAANTASHRPDMGDLAEDAILALPASAHAHIKDVRRTEQGWFFTPIGDGEVGCGRLLRAVAELPGFPVSIELPLRLHRGADAQPIRRYDPVPLTTIEEMLTRSLKIVRQAFGQIQ
ncbi:MULTISPECIES: sugar phosphate isomerase/epimerase family protein [Ensifer]|jgi:sugar phosphate isomerase/epimerase|uniref:sugar phosphate isomerase/epimerase family protein n=1 Tax=Ensifer TaxID=106591 RepID=UPI000713DB3E|nr:MULTISPECIES: sugar phosphate isomerase/epimerase family protein [Ensifer]KQX51311.1 TIM alpha/beta barrel domain-containing protein [Ensifer sp. Root1298]KQX83676.1 TIM alpha/beta barrel domain-containing protein [Ensifer sp. Root1312]KRC20021.1 TIM alpha/beta barrel domain-containing protein [Ensifer sp. Root74]KRD63268.1 TIM alpha/beta barrel domain-containing protein [Ensifer sp. Root954]